MFPFTAAGETTLSILRALSEMRQKGFENDLDGIDLRTFRTGDKISLGNIQLEPIHVDHSVPGSYGFLVHTSSGTIAYSGDFRAHGSKSSLTTDFVDAAKNSNPEIFFLEGKMLVKGDLRPEKEVLKNRDK